MSSRFTNQLYTEENTRSGHGSRSSTPLVSGNASALSIMDLTNQQLFGPLSSAAVAAQGSRRGSLRPILDPTMTRTPMGVSVPPGATIMDPGELENALLQTSAVVSRPPSLLEGGSSNNTTTTTDEYCKSPSISFSMLNFHVAPSSWCPFGMQPCLDWKMLPTQGTLFALYCCMVLSYALYGIRYWRHVLVPALQYLLWCKCLSRTLLLLIPEFTGQPKWEADVYRWQGSWTLLDLLTSLRTLLQRPKSHERRHR